MFFFKLEMLPSEMFFNIRNVKLEHIEFFHQNDRMQYTAIQVMVPVKPTSTSKGN